MALPIQSVGNQTNTITLTVSSGSTLVVATMATNASAQSLSSITDDHSQTYTIAAHGPSAIGRTDGGAAYLTNTVAGSITITANYSNSLLQGCILVQEFSKADAVSFDIKDTANSTTGTNPVSGTTGTTNQANETVVGWVLQLSATLPTAGSGYGNLVSQAGSSAVGVAIENKTVTSTGTQQATFTNASSVQYVCGVMTFKKGTIVFLTSGTTSYQTPADWDAANNIVEVLGAGGAGYSDLTNSGGGGGGGGYARGTNFAANLYTTQVPSGGSASACFFSGSGVLQGTSGSTATSATGGAAGAGSGSSATTTNNGGTGGTGGSFLGAGGGGGNGGTTSGPTTSGGGGGGGGGTIGAGGNGAIGTAGTAGVGGGGVGATGTGANGQAGGNGTSFDATHGSGGGGSGAGAISGLNGGNGGNYGAGGGGSTSTGTGGSGIDGLIIITYAPLATSSVRLRCLLGVGL